MSDKVKVCALRRFYCVLWCGGLIAKCVILLTMDIINTCATTEQPVALVTGASTGIGAAVAKRLGGEGYFVWVNYRSSHAEAQAIVDAIVKAGGRAEIICANVGDISEIDRMFAEIRSRSGRLDVLVNNAGICPFLNWDEISPEDWDKTHNINLRGAFFCTQHAAKLMIENNIAGRIVAMSSISAIKGGTVQAHYCPTKGGLISMMAAFAVSLGRYGITCNSVLPGTIETVINKDYLAVPENREPLERSTCVGYIGQPDDVAGIVAFLVRQEARYITGSSILVDGGEFVNHL